VPHFSHWTACLGGVILLLAGCGPSRGTIPLEGRVTRAGGPPPNRGRVIFSPLVVNGETEPAPAGRFALGVFDAGGAYRASSFTEGDGILPGRYEVSVEFGDMQPSGPNPHDFHSQPASPDRALGPPLEIRANGPRSIRYDIDLP
jgi:hypothetical protein